MHEGEEYKFQSTPPVKAATSLSRFGAARLKFQSTPPVKAATDSPNNYVFTDIIISIHAAREGGDLIGIAPANARGIFQSTPPVKAAT